MQGQHYGSRVDKCLPEDEGNGSGGGGGLHWEMALSIVIVRLSRPSRPPGVHKCLLPRPDQAFVATCYVLSPIASGLMGRTPGTHLALCVCNSL